MERKLLWVISSIVIVILWLKIEPQSTTPATDSDTTEQAVEKAESKAKQPAKSDTAKSSTDATKEEREYFQSHPIDPNKPDFAAIEDVQTRKDAFFEFLIPFANEKNALLLKDRERLIKILENPEPPTREEKTWLAALRKIHNLRKVGVYTHEDIAALLKYVDIIPTSLVLAQAANESAWGTSRFAVEGNNYFGQWCFRKGCGLVPNARGEAQDHEVKKFSDARESVFAYIDNLNSNSAYKELRAIRAKLREQNKTITGLALVHGLEHYSQRGQDYIDEIGSLIDYNELWRFNLHGDDTTHYNE
ncbi:glucosaminidase domain-containing protein [Marinomonas ostreistagni]|uniref:glucosaminidase domain-containing protein n=1 Tax=Marinomonas ostreistagni TaxID=359209 RepID=UPI00194FC3F6|nr:glucosaminidase domain-containing protein [Marinomonas ostreistagni]MBM6551202.1 glucosaminidase domain-containing protein [Marinomonas ostreistagni]